MNCEGILKSYPRERPSLSQAHQKHYVTQYKINREGASAIDKAAKILEKWMHKKVSSQKGEAILELGAGTLNHLEYEPNIEAYDIVEPFKSLYEDKTQIGCIRAAYDTIQAIPSINRYRRIVSIAVLEHLTNLPADVAKSALLLEDGGVFQAGIPSEGGLLWWLGWRFSTGIAYYLRTGLDYGVIMRHEHVSNARDIIQIVNYFYDDVEITRFPLPFLQLSFYTYIEARRPRAMAARKFLDGLEIGA